MKTEIDPGNKTRIDCIKRMFPATSEMSDAKIFKALRRANNRANHAIDMWRRLSGRHIDADCKKIIWELYEILGDDRCKMWGLCICVDASPKLRLGNFQTIHVNLREKMGCDDLGVFLFVDATVEDDEEREPVVNPFLQKVR